MTLVLSIAAGYVLGRVLASLGSTACKVLIRQMLEGSPKWQRLVRLSLKRDAALRATLVGPWVTRSR